MTQWRPSTKLRSCIRCGCEEKLEQPFIEGECEDCLRKARPADPIRSRAVPARFIGPAVILAAILVGMLGLGGWIFWMRSPAITVEKALQEQARPNEVILPAVPPLPELVSPSPAVNPDFLDHKSRDVAMPNPIPTELPRSAAPLLVPPVSDAIRDEAAKERADADAEFERSKAMVISVIEARERPPRDIVREAILTATARMTKAVESADSMVARVRKAKINRLAADDEEKSLVVFRSASRKSQVLAQALELQTQALADSKQMAGLAKKASKEGITSLSAEECKMLDLALADRASADRAYTESGFPVATPFVMPNRGKCFEAIA